MKELDCIKDEKHILSLGFDSVMEYKKCMKCDYTNINVPVGRKKSKCNGEQALNCKPYLLAYQYKDRVNRERGIVRGVGTHPRNTIEGV